MLYYTVHGSVLVSHQRERERERERERDAQQTKHTERHVHKTRSVCHQQMNCVSIQNKPAGSPEHADALQEICRGRWGRREREGEGEEIESKKGRERARKRKNSGRDTM